jgi:ubiquinone/menaquinone biosynthesis C-methylase UbiE
VNPGDPSYLALDYVSFLTKCETYERNTPLKMASQHPKSASNITTNDVVFGEITSRLFDGAVVADLGCGRGHMVSRLTEYADTNKLKVTLIAVDFDDTIFEPTATRSTKLNLNEPLPFADQSIDILYSIEVIEHLENQYAFIRECGRVLKKGGTLIVTTPNVLNIASRFRFFAFGIPEIYEFPSAKVENAGRICGHINMINQYYFDLALRKVDFRDARYITDKGHPGSLFWYYLLIPLWRYLDSRNRGRLFNQDPSVAAENSRNLDQAFSKTNLVSRSLVCIASR